MRLCSLLLGAVLPAVACAPSWELMYSESLARVLRHETPESAADHLRILHQVDDAYGGAPPPAIDLELAYYAQLLGEPAEAEAALARERARYPEFGAVIDRAARDIRTLPALESVRRP